MQYISKNTIVQSSLIAAKENMGKIFHIFHKEYMSKFKIGAALLGIAFLFVLLKTVIQWQSIFPAQIITSSSTEEKKKSSLGNQKEKTIRVHLPNTSQPIIEQAVLPEDFFDVEALAQAGYTLVNGRYALALFQHAPVMAQRDLFYPVTFTLKKDGKDIGTISRILPSEEMSSARLFSLVRQKLENVVKGKESEIFNVSKAYSTAGEANFYFNDKGNFPKTVFMITRSKTKVLAFQIEEEYHDAAKKSIHLFFQ